MPPWKAKRRRRLARERVASWDNCTINRPLLYTLMKPSLHSITNNPGYPSQNAFHVSLETAMILYCTIPSSLKLPPLFMPISSFLGIPAKLLLQLFHIILKKLLGAWPVWFCNPISNMFVICCLAERFARPSIFTPPMSAGSLPC